MSILNPQTKEIHCKIVYYGPALAGKTTSLHALQEKVKTKKAPLKKDIPGTERTLFFDFLALSAQHKIRDYKVHFQVYTVPGQALYEDSRRLLLNGVDGIIFVADSRLEYVEDSLKSWNELALNLKKLGDDPASIPTVIQYNKRDSKTAARVEDLSEAINTRKLPEFSTTASTGKGVVEAFEAVAQGVIESLKK